MHCHMPCTTVACPSTVPKGAKDEQQYDCHEYPEETVAASKDWNGCFLGAHDSCSSRCTSGHSPTNSLAMATSARSLATSSASKHEVSSRASAKVSSAL